MFNRGPPTVKTHRPAALSTLFYILSIEHAIKLSYQLYQGRLNAFCVILHIINYNGKVGRTDLLLIARCWRVLYRAAARLPITRLLTASRVSANQHQGEYVQSALGWIHSQSASR